MVIVLFILVFNNNWISMFELDDVMLWNKMIVIVVDKSVLGSEIILVSY